MSAPLPCAFCGEDLVATSPAHPGAWFHHFNECVLEGFSVVGNENIAAWNRRSPHIEDVLADAAVRAEKCLAEWKASPDMIDDVTANVMHLPKEPT